MRDNDDSSFIVSDPEEEFEIAIFTYPLCGKIRLINFGLAFIGGLYKLLVDRHKSLSLYFKVFLPWPTPIFFVDDSDEMSTILCLHGSL